MPARALRGTQGRLLMASHTELFDGGVLQHGVVTANYCGNTTASPQPGEIIIFVRPLTWWEKLKT